MHLIGNNSIRALRLREFAVLSAVVVLAAAFSTAMAGTCTRTFGFVTASTESKFWMIDKTTHKVVAEIPKDGPRQTVVTPDGETRYSVNTKENVVVFVNKCDSDERHSICVRKGPYGLALSLDGKKLFVFSRIADTISVIDTRENKVEEVDPAPKYNFGIKVTEDGYLTAVK
ncbi:MAG: hypothetical protein JOY62_09760 [Acidobacteriaceae bacterium]|nr:hypothetical protein [Acidobacteriaceae bacterium]